MVRRVNAMIALLARIDNGEDVTGRIKRSLDRKQASYIKRLHAHSRVTKRHGKTAPPKSVLDVGILQLEVQSRIASALEGSLDVARFKVSYASPVYRRRYGGAHCGHQ